MTFACCPECGVTNFFEKNNRRFYDCGFVGHYSTREARCGQPQGVRQVERSATATQWSDEYFDYLVLLSSAYVIGSIAEELQSDGALDHAQRCRALANHVMALAGSIEPSLLDDQRTVGRATDRHRFFDILRSKLSALRNRGSKFRRQVHD